MNLKIYKMILIKKKKNLREIIKKKVMKQLDY